MSFNINDGTRTGKDWMMPKDQSGTKELGGSCDCAQAVDTANRVLFAT